MIWLDFFLQAFVQTLACCFAVIVSLGLFGACSAALKAIRSLGAGR